MRTILKRCARSLVASGALLGSLSTPAAAAIIEISGPSESIQAAIDAAQNGDIIRVAPGVYNESLDIAPGKSVSLVSHFVQTNDPSLIAQTVISGAGLGAGGTNAAFGILVRTLSGPITVIGFTIRDAQNGISAFAELEFGYGRITATADGIDFENNSRGRVHHSTLDFNTDDGIDLDNEVDVTIEDCQIVDNSDDGIEIRLHDMPGYVGPTLQILIRNNEISRNGEDGIQLIDDTMLTPREFHIEGNVIADNTDAGIGMMCCQNTVEDFQAASIRERIVLVGNTIRGNDHGVTGGDNLIALNNLVVDSLNIGLKGADAASIAAYNGFFGNGTDFSASNIDLSTTLLADPMLDPNDALTSGSPAIDAGIAFYEHATEVVLDLPPSLYAPPAPDLGANEYLASVPSLPLAGLGALVVSLATLGAVQRRLARRGAR